MRTWPTADDERDVVEWRDTGRTRNGREAASGGLSVFEPTAFNTRALSKTWDLSSEEWKPILISERETSGAERIFNGVSEPPMVRGGWVRG